jgi:peroxiredoxin
MPSYTTADLRNLAFVGQGGAGKTSLVEALLHTAGAIHHVGLVEKGTTVSDYTDDEKCSGSPSGLRGDPAEFVFCRDPFVCFCLRFGDISYHSWDICRSAGQSAQIGPVDGQNHSSFWLDPDRDGRIFSHSIRGLMGLKRGVVKKEKNFDFRCLGVIFLIFWIILSCSETSQSPISLKTVEGKARDFMLKDLNNQKFLLSEQQGKPVLLIFSTTWCPTCRSEIPHYKKIHEIYTSRGLVIANIDIQESQDKVSRFKEKFQLPYQVLLDETGRVAEAYSIVGVPTMILIDQEGHIRSRQYQAIDDPLKTLFSGS